MGMFDKIKECEKLEEELYEKSEEILFTSTNFDECLKRLFSCYEKMELNGIDQLKTISIKSDFEKIIENIKSHFTKIQLPSECKTLDFSIVYGGTSIKCIPTFAICYQEEISEDDFEDELFRGEETLLELDCEVLGKSQDLMNEPIKDQSKPYAYSNLHWCYPIMVALDFFKFHSSDFIKMNKGQLLIKAGVPEAQRLIGLLNDSEMKFVEYEQDYLEFLKLNNYQFG